MRSEAKDWTEWAGMHQVAEGRVTGVLTITHVMNCRVGKRLGCRWEDTVVVWIRFGVGVS